MFEKDKTLFSFALCIRIMKGENRVDDAELRYLLVGPTSDMLEKGPMIPAEWAVASDSIHFVGLRWAHNVGMRS